MTLEEAANRVGVTAATLRRWVRQALIPQPGGAWTPAAIGQGRVVARMRERGHSLAEIGRATEEGRLALGFLEVLLPTDQERYTIRQASREAGLEPGLMSRILTGLGISREHSGTISEDELQLLRYVAAALESGFPLAALLQLVRVYGHAMAQVADAEVRLFHLYVHEPLPRIAVHYGVALYRDGDDYGRDVNIASRVAARSGGGEVLVTRPVVNEVGPHLEFERIAEIKLKGFNEATEIFVARALEDE
jgi:adenylate cyclase